MGKMAEAGFARLGYFKPDYDHLMITGHEKSAAIDRAREIVLRDSMPPPCSLLVQPHYAPDDKSFLGLSFRRMDKPFFLHTNHHLVDFVEQQVASIDDVIAAHLGAAERERRILRRAGSFSKSLARQAWGLATGYDYEGRMFDVARRILITIDKGQRPAEMRLG